MNVSCWAAVALPSHENSVSQIGLPNCSHPARLAFDSIYARSDGRSQLYQCTAMWSTSQPAHAVRKSVRYTYGSVPLQLAAGPQKFIPGPTIDGTPALRALVDKAGHAV